MADNVPRIEFSLADLDVGISFDDVFLVPKRSKISLLETPYLNTSFTPNIKLKHPFVSGSSVSGERMAIEMARNGGIAIVKNLKIDEQSDIISKVKSAQNFIKTSDVTVFSENSSIFSSSELIDKTGTKSHPVCGPGGIFLGMIGVRDFYRIKSNGLITVSECCTPKVACVTGPPNISRIEAEDLFARNKSIDNIPLVAKDGTLAGMISMDLLDKTRNSDSVVSDINDNLRVAASIGYNASFDKIRKLVEVGTDVLVLEEDHAYTVECMDVCRKIRERYSKFESGSPEIIAGNVFACDAIEGFMETYSQCIDGVKIAQPKSALDCGFGVPLLTSIFECANYCHEMNMTAVADIGNETEANMVKALAAGADALIVNKQLADTKESISKKKKYSSFDDAVSVVREWNETVQQGVFYGGGTMERLRRDATWIYKVSKK